MARTMSLHDVIVPGCRQPILSAELVDLLTEHVTQPADPADRARVIETVIECLADAVRWRNEPRDDGFEETSLGLVTEAARRHLARVQGR